MQKTLLMASGTRVRCTFGSQTALVHAPYEKGMTMNGCKILTQADCIPKINIGDFGTCNADANLPKPCQIDGVWQYTCDMFVADEDEALTTESCIVCGCGGGVIRYDG